MGFRLRIDGEWDATEFADFFQTLDNLHNHLCMSLEYETLAVGRPMAFGLRRSPIGSRYRLDVKRIEFGSPGFTDLVGLAAAMREMRELIQFIISFCSQRKDRKIARERASIENAKLRLEILQRIYELEREFGPHVPEGAESYFGLKRGMLPDLDPLIQAVIDERLVGVEGTPKDTK